MGVDLGNVQSLVMQVLRATRSRHHLFAFGPDVAEARAFLRGLAPRVALGRVEDPQVTQAKPLLALGLTAPGLRALGMVEGLYAALDSNFREGPDAGALRAVPGSWSDKATWLEGRFKTEDVHLVISVNVDSEEELEATSRDLRELAKGHGARELIPRENGTTIDGVSMGGGLLHFGYTDGFSQPTVDWGDTKATGTLDSRNFVLGYASPEVPSAPGYGPTYQPAADFVRDSSYAVFQWLYQDVAAFNGYLKANGPATFPELAAPDAEELLAAKMMGRWRNGTPLVESPDAPVPPTGFTNGFGYGTQDPHGFRCPFSAHIRVVNPRDEGLDPIVVDGVPRVLRRGMPYGPPLPPEETADDGKDRGLAGIFLCTDVQRQFYTLCGWIDQNTFSPVYDPDRNVQDALVANRRFPGADRSFSIPQEDGPPKVVKNLPDFVRTKGALLLLVPSGRTMARLSQG